MTTDNAQTSPAMEPMDYIMVESPRLVDQDIPETIPDKISAYYSLAFPNFTYYLQTLNVSIGRRSVRPDAASSSETPQVDVDLGPLKSVSRLHARIEYEESQERFVLVVLGRNGAWVDGVWSGSGSRVPLGARSTIQIATRIFHFVLPPPPAPEDSPSPSSPSSSARHLSPSIDVTSISPASSVTSPPPTNKDLPSNVVDGPIAQSKYHSPANSKANGKKRKKPEPDIPPPPEVMPARPSFTLAELSFMAIKALDGKATLQEVCTWIRENFEWYRYNESTGWPSSIRHNLSSNRSFKKMERCSGERGKGFFWSIDPRFEHKFEDLDGIIQGSSSAGGKEGSKGKGKNAKLLEPPLKRSAKSDPKPPLPPPLTSTPLPAFTAAQQANANLPISTPQQPAQQVSSAAPEPSPADILDVKTEQEDNQAVRKPQAKSDLSGMPSQVKAESSPTQPLLASSASTDQLPGDMKVPIVIGPTSPAAGSSETSSSSKNFDLSSPPISFQKQTIILNPTIFSSLTSEQLKGLEELGAKKAIEILQGYIVRFLKEKIKTEGTKVKGKTKQKKNKGHKKKDGTGMDAGNASEAVEAKAGKSSSTSNDIASGSTTKPKPKPDLSSAPFTTQPLPPRKPVHIQNNTGSDASSVLATAIGLAQAVGPLHISSPPSIDAQMNEEVDILGDFDEPLTKKRRLDFGELQA